MPTFVICETCGKPFSVKPYKAKKARYCSQPCLYAGRKVNPWRKPPTYVKCGCCGIQFSIKNKYLKEVNYCSKKCAYDARCRGSIELGFWRCSSCGQNKPLDQFDTTKPKKNRRATLLCYCKPCRRAIKLKKISTSHGRFMSAIRTAKRRGLSWDIKEEDFSKLIKQVCFYCGRPLCSTGCGLDRIDNKKGYSDTNVVPCCGRCNTTRGARFTHTEMILLAETIKKIDSARSDCSDGSHI